MTTPPNDATSTTRRQLLRTGALGAAAAAFLAACGTSSDSQAGLSGVDPTTSVVPPTVPPREPTEIDLELDQTLLRTATSLELMAAEAYGEFAGEVQDGEWAATTARFGVDHELAAGAFRSGTDADLQIDEPNEFMQTQLIDPVRDLLTSDRSLLNFFTEIENTLSATYVTAVANHTDAAWRARFSAYASSAARRAALMGAGGQGVVPTGPLLGTEDLIPGEAYLQANPAVEEPVAGEEGEGSDGAPADGGDGEPGDPPPASEDGTTE